MPNPEAILCEIESPSAASAAALAEIAVACARDQKRPLWVQQVRIAHSSPRPPTLLLRRRHARLRPAPVRRRTPRHPARPQAASERRARVFGRAAGNCGDHAMNALTSLFAYAGLASLALAMSRHHRTVFNREITPRRCLALLTAGWLLLTLSVAVAFQTHGFGLGAVYWFATVASAGFVLTLLLAYAPRLWPLPLACLLLLAAQS